MKVTHSGNDTIKGPADWFTGDVYIDMIPAGSAPSRLGAASVHFTPGARTTWHTHPLGQTIFVTEGVGLCQREGGPVETIRPGDSVYFEPGGTTGTAPRPRTNRGERGRRCRAALAPAGPAARPL
jgi:quercetin dioxygenase-like cupin family protein